MLLHVGIIKEIKEILHGNGILLHKEETTYALATTQTPGERNLLVEGDLSGLDAFSSQLKQDINTNQSAYHAYLKSTSGSFS